MAQHKPNDRTGVEDVVKLAKQLAKATPGSQREFGFQMFGHSYVLTAQVTGFGTLFLSVKDDAREDPLAAEEYDLTDHTAIECIADIAGSATSRYIRLNTREDTVRNSIDL